ncbi:MAG: hypothetical protein IJX51_02775 [Clostridia bacterium]|nr:hypothetical protein [Clostridia bacterium]
MRKLILIILLLVIFLPSCSDTPGHGDIPLENTELCTTGKPREPTSYVFVLNMSTKKFHLQNCKYATSIREENRIETDDIQYIYSLEYSPCSICNPDRY